MIFQGLVPQVHAVRKAIFTNKTDMNLQCNVLGQPMTTIQWKVDSEIITNEGYYNANSFVTKRTSNLNTSYISRLGISNKILYYFVKKTDSHCKLADVNNTIDCTLIYTCKAFYVENEASQEDIVAVFKYNGEWYLI